MKTRVRVKKCCGYHEEGAVEKSTWFEVEDLEEWKKKFSAVSCLDSFISYEIEESEDLLEKFNLLYDKALLKKRVELEALEKRKEAEAMKKAEKLKKIEDMKRFEEWKKQND